MPDEYLKLLDKKGIKYIKDSDLNRHMPEIDVLYMTRVQQERFTDEKEYLALKGSYILTPKIVKMGKPGMRILHPLPRVDEITSEVDDMPQAAYFRQVENGVYMRMAIIKSLVSNYYN
jgi:aspartate carbamoyltransferase catalytic subunit